MGRGQARGLVPEKRKHQEQKSRSAAALAPIKPEKCRLGDAAEERNRKERTEGGSHHTRNLKLLQGPWHRPIKATILVGWSASVRCTGARGAAALDTSYRAAAVVTVRPLLCISQQYTMYQEFLDCSFVFRSQSIV